MSPARGKRAADLVLLPLGGAGEIGMNCYAYGLGTLDRRDWLLVDLGVKFGDELDPGVDVILPDVSFIASNRRNLAGLVLTHAHEDHIGAVPWLWPQLRCPIYCTAFCAAILANKLKEHGLEEDVEVNILPIGQRFALGPFGLEFIAVTHSIPEPTALLIETPQGRVLHSGDWKIDRTPSIPPLMDEARLRAIGDAGVDALVCDSTNVLRTGHSPSESQVAETLHRVVAEAKGRVAITTFASHVGRIATAVAAARARSREVVIAGRAMHKTIQAARTCGYLQDAGVFLEEEAFGYLPPDKTLLLCTGSQGEPRAALARIARDEHAHVVLEPGDLVVFSSKTIPGNEKAVGQVHNDLALHGIDILTSDDALIHTSGHPRQGELRELYEWLSPRAVVPMHGEPRHLRVQAQFARSCGVPEAIVVKNGDIVRLAPGPTGVIDEAPAGRLHVDGKLIVPSEEGPARHRRKLAFAGIVFVSIALDDRQSLAADPEIVMDGIPANFGERLLDAVEQAFESTPRPRRADDEALGETLRVAIRRAADAAWGKKPVCRVAILRV